MAAPPSPSLSASQLATLAAVGEERTAGVGDALYRLGDATYPFIAIREGGGAVLDSGHPPPRRLAGARAGGRSGPADRAPPRRHRAAASIPRTGAARTRGRPRAGDA